MKKLVLSSLFLMTLVWSHVSHAQKPKGPYFWGEMLYADMKDRFGAGVQGGMNRTDMDFGLNGNAWHAGAHFNANVLRFLQLNVEYNYGVLKGGPLFLEGPYNSLLLADFQTETHQINTIARIMPLRVLMWDRTHKAIEFFTYMYAGLGYGYMVYNVDAAPMYDPQYGHENVQNGKANVIIQEFGIDLPIVKFGKSGSLFLGFNYRFNKTNSDLIDGYNPTVEANQHNDVFSTYTANLTFRF